MPLSLRFYLCFYEECILFACDLVLVDHLRAVLTVLYLNEWHDPQWDPHICEFIW